MCFAANVLGARGALLLVLVHFFEHGRWGSPVETGVAEHSLTAEDQLFILTQATLYLTATRGPASPEMRICYQLAEPLCHSLNRPLLLYVSLMGQWRASRYCCASGHAHRQGGSPLKAKVSTARYRYASAAIAVRMSEAEPLDTCL
jgi:hypothetical protein